MSKKSSIKKCYRCGQEIYFHPDHKSPNGKFVPLDVDTNSPHDCRKSTFKPSPKTVMEQINDLDEKETERIRKISYE